MTCRELVETLDRIAQNSQQDPEMAHGEADAALLAYISDPRKVKNTLLRYLVRRLQRRALRRYVLATSPALRKLLRPCGHR